MGDKKIERIDSYVFDERFYRMADEYRPSLTYILGLTYPSGDYLAQWRGDVGNRRADEILEETSEDGSFVHESIEIILKGGYIDREQIEGRFSPKRSLKIMRCLRALLDWYEEYQPQTISTEYVVWHEKFAGTVDYKCIIGSETYTIDFKTSKTINDKHKAQVCGYCDAHPTDKVAILHLGNATKKRYSFIILDEDQRKKYTDQCKESIRMFHAFYPNAKPNEETFPDVFKLETKSKTKK